MSMSFSHSSLAASSSSGAESSPLLVLPTPREHSLTIRARALVFEDPLSRQLLARMRQVAPSQANILIIGETGTGKELVARHIHELSSRAPRPFVAVNCAALTESLAESELFGHEKGAFTGAVASKPGWFETANGGTLFLDEVGDLSLSLQVKLLRVLQEREVVRVGARKPIPIDVRIITATNVNLEEAVKAGRFREDLFYRIKVAAIALPPLRQRPGDIPPLVRYFSEVYGQRLGSGPVEIGAETMARLIAYPWPGNIRELENVIHHALLVCPGALVRPEDLSLSPLPSASSQTAPDHPDRRGAAILEQALGALYEQAPPNLFDSIVDIVIRTAYEHCHRNQVHTARLLGISRNVLRAHLLRQGQIGQSLRMA